MFQSVTIQYAVVHNNGHIHQFFNTLDSAKFMLTEYKLGDKIYEVALIKGKPVANLGEIE